MREWGAFAEEFLVDIAEHKFRADVEMPQTLFNIRRFPLILGIASQLKLTRSMYIESPNSMRALIIVSLELCSYHRT